MALIPNTGYKYSFRYYLINSSGDIIAHRSDAYDDPHILIIALMNSYRLLELKILGDLYLMRQNNPTYDLNILKINHDFRAARRIISELCHDVNIPTNLTKNRTVLNFVPDKNSIPMREVFMEIIVSKNETKKLIKANFSPVQYRFINKYFKYLPRLPTTNNISDP